MTAKPIRLQAIALSGGGNIYDADGKLVCVIRDGDLAKSIVHRVNSHDGLVEVLKEAYEFIGNQDKNPIYVDSAVPIIWKIEQALKNEEGK